MKIATTPETLPLLCLSGTILFPRMRLPLNIFEPHYIDMVSASLGEGRMIGLVQPRDENDKSHHPALFRVGCAGRITSFAETEDGRFLITLMGTSRFEITEDVSGSESFRRAHADFSRFEDDHLPPDQLGYDRTHLTALLRSYIQTHGIGADWSVLQHCDDEELVSSLSMVCAFLPSEKQALLEAPSFPARARTLIALLEMACLRGEESEAARH